MDRRPSESEVRGWRIGALLAPLLVLSTGAFAVLYGGYSPALLGVLAAWLVLLLAWALALALTSGWRRRGRRAAYVAAVVGSFAAFGVAVAWRALGAGAGLGAVLVALFCAVVAAGLLLGQRLSAVLTWRLGGGAAVAARTAGVSAATLGFVLLLVLRLAPVWFAQHLLLPVMLLAALIAAAGLRGGAFR